MDALVLVFLLVNTALLLWLPRRWAPIPLLIGVCYVPPGQWIELGPFTFGAVRILIGVGLARLFFRREWLTNRMNGLDWLMTAWAIWALFSSGVLVGSSAVFINRLGLVYDACGIYLLIRISVQSFEDLAGVFRIIALLLVPVGVTMVYENITGNNLFYMLGQTRELAGFRAGGFRAQGPFANSILAGTVGAVCLPLMIGLWQQHRKRGGVGIGACIAMIFASGSTGPILSGFAGIGGLFLWRLRRRIILIIWLTVLGYMAISLVMELPPYYLIADIDLTGGSTGGHRAKLIESAFEHLHEWWWRGTDYTRHWMASGYRPSPYHVDITNHYIRLGVLGGLPLMILFICLLGKGFAYVRHMVKDQGCQRTDNLFALWTLGASLFAHVVTMLGVSYYDDQSPLFLYMDLAVIGSIWSESRESQACGKMEVGRSFVWKPILSD